jgi:hypothetical protein
LERAVAPCPKFKTIVVKMGRFSRKYSNISHIEGSEEGKKGEKE